MDFEAGPGLVAQLRAAAQQKAEKADSLAALSQKVRDEAEWLIRTANHYEASEQAARLALLKVMEQAGVHAEGAAPDVPDAADGTTAEEPADATEAVPAPQVARPSASTQAMTIIRAGSPDEVWTTGRLLARMPEPRPTRATLGTALQRLAARGDLERVGDGRNAGTYRLRQIPPLPSDVTVSAPPEGTGSEQGGRDPRSGTTVTAPYGNPGPQRIARPVADGQPSGTPADGEPRVGRWAQTG